MMKKGTSFLKRCFALALALVLLVSAMNLGTTLQVFATGSESTRTTPGKLVADNYDLTEAEEALLSSGYLAGDTIGIATPTAETAEVTVDPDTKTISAAVYQSEWIPTMAEIVVGGETVETVTLEDGEGTYNYGENVFSVKVTYEWWTSLEAEAQQSLLNTPAWLKQGIANVDAVAGQDGNLYILEQAMPELVKFAANGVQTSLGEVGFSDECKAAVNALNAQMTANGGVLNLSVMIDAYGDAFKTQYLLKNGADMQAEVVSFVDNISTINLALTTMVDNLTLFIQNGWVDQTTAEQLKMLAGVAGNLEAGLATVAADPWTAAEKGTDLVNVNKIEAYEAWTEVDALVTAVTNTTTVTEFENPLLAATTAVSVNMSMFNVTVNVVLNVVENKADSAKLVEHGTKTAVVTVAEGATKDEILAEISANGVEAAALAEWAADGKYVDGKFNVVLTELPETLTEDIEYTITWSPAPYTVTSNYADNFDVPYGYQYILPKHSNADQAYDYKVTIGTAPAEDMAQGQIVVITDSTHITREAGKSYTTTDLYTVVSNNFGNETTKAILQSGALKDNLVINYRKPDPADVGSLLKLEDGILEGKNYASDYEGLEWVPYSYNGNLFNGNSASWSESSAKVIYRLNLTNIGVYDVQGILELAALLKEQAAAQKSTLDGLASGTGTMAQLDKTKLGALNGAIDVTDFTPEDGTEEDAKNLELRAYFKSVVSNIIAKNVDKNNQLKIYNMLVKYNDDGLSYYYNNSAAVIAEIESLSGYLTELLDEEEALKILLVAALGKEDGEKYGAKITDLENQLADVMNALTAPNAAIDLASENLGKLITALTSGGTVVNDAAATAYIDSEVLTVTDSSQVIVQVIISTPKGGATVTTEPMDKGTVLTAEVVDDLIARANAEIKALLGDNSKYYMETTSFEADLIALVGTEVNAQVDIYSTYDYVTYTVKIEGEADQVVNIDNLEIKLPKHPTSGWEYRYTIDGKEDITASTYTFTAEQLDRLFANNTYTVTRVAVNASEEKLEQTFGDWLVRDQEGTVVGLNPKVAGDKDGLMNFAMTMVNSGYTYIALNGEPLMYMNDEDTLEICLQTLVNAVLADNTFSQDTLINLGSNGSGKLVAAKMDLGNSAEDITYSDLNFVMELSSVPTQMATVAKGLTTIKPYMTFKSVDGILDVTVDLPEKVYEAYLTAMLATGHVDKNDITAIDEEIAYQFLWDYVDLILATDADTTTYTNTLAKLGIDRDLTGYEGYYDMLKELLTNEGVVVNEGEPDGEFTISIDGKSKPAIQYLINFLGIDVSAYETYLGMIKEYKYDDAHLAASAKAHLKDAGTAFEALIVDVDMLQNGEGVKGKMNGVDYVTDLPARLNSVAGHAAVILLGDVDGNLNFPGKTILDLNGKTVNGSISGDVYIVDSSMSTANAGTVTGSVNATAVFGGNYEIADVTPYLKSGYKQVGKNVQNVLYTIESDGTDVTFNVNTDVLSEDVTYTTFAKAVALDVAVDVILNYYTSAALSADGFELYNVNVDDLVALLESTSKVDDLIQKVLNSIDVPAMSDFVNVVLADLLNFEEIEKAAAGDGIFATYTLSTAPWKVNVSHETEEDYITLDVISNPELAEEFDVSLKLSGSKVAYVEKLAGALDEVVESAEAEIDVLQPVYVGENNTLTVEGSASANAVVDLSVNENYTTIIAVILANASENKYDWANAVNNGDMDALKALIDNTSVEEVFTALKKLSRNVGFAKLAENTGVIVDVDAAAELEEVYHLILCAAGKALEELEITGMDSKLGALYNAETGYYELVRENITRSADASARGYTVACELTDLDVSLKVKLFGEETPDDCDLKNPDHKEDVNIKDLIYLRKLLAAENMDALICKACADVHEDDVIDMKDIIALRKYLAAKPQQ